MRWLLAGLVGLLLGSACGRPAEPPAASPAVAPPPAAAPNGPLARLTARHWDGPVVPWRAAVVDRLVDPANPLGLRPRERREALEAVRLYVVARERYFFRLGRLDRLLGKRYRRPSGPDPGPAVEETFLEGAPPLLARLAARGPAPALDPYPPDLVKPHGLLGTEHERPWDPSVAMDPGRLLALLVEVEPGLSEDEARQALGEVREIEGLVRDMRQAWLSMTSLATRGNRSAATASRARQLEPADSTEDRMFDQAMAWLFAHWEEAMGQP